MSDIKNVLYLHDKWLSGSPDGKKANLSRANLSRANLSEANLSGAYLSGAKGFILLPVQDARGYSFPHATLTTDGWQIRAGCRLLGIDDARQHWGESYEGDREIGDMYLYACDWLKKKLSRMEQEERG